MGAADVDVTGDGSGRAVQVRDGRRDIVGLGLPLLLLGTYAYFAVAAPRFNTLANTRTVPELIAMMVGRSFSELFHREASPIGDELLRVEALGRKGWFDGISLSVNAGEVVGWPDSSARAGRR